ncbi:MAG: lamin tail domain-containing protein, partial [Saprospiraceae bacterium]|nr:lamin tail domain-containing protein [Saprospiraceae bacterium]
MPSYLFKHAIYLVLLCQLPLHGQRDLIISEYVEGSGRNKCIEIFNPTSSSIDLDASNYRLVIYANGSETFSVKSNLSGSLAPGHVHVVCEAGMGFSGADQTFTAGHNGNDAVAIIKGSTDRLVDLFGNIGCDPGSGWSSGGMSTVDRTLRRRPCLGEGVSQDPGQSCAFPTLRSEWIGSSRDDLSGLGRHDYKPKFLDAPNLADPMICGGSTQVSILASGYNLEYSINSGASWQESPVFPAVFAGSYHVQIRERDDLGCMAKWPHRVEINEPLPPEIDQIVPFDAETCGGTGTLLLQGLLQDGQYVITFDHDGAEKTRDEVLAKQGTLELSGLNIGRYENIQVMNLSTECSSPIQRGTYFIEGPTRPRIGSIAVIDAPQCGGLGIIRVTGLRRNERYSISYEHNGKFNAQEGISARRGKLELTQMPIGNYKNIQVTHETTQCSSEKMTKVYTIGEPIPPEIADIIAVDRENCKALGQVMLDGLDADKVYRVNFLADGGRMSATEMSNAHGNVSLFLPDGAYADFHVQDQGTLCFSATRAGYVRLKGPAPITARYRSVRPVTCLADGAIAIEGLERHTSYEIEYRADGRNQSSMARTNGGGIIMLSLPAGVYSHFSLLQVRSGCRAPLMEEEIILEAPQIPAPTIRAMSPEGCSTTGIVFIEDLVALKTYQVRFKSSNDWILEDTTADALGKVQLSLAHGSYSDFQVMDLESGCRSSVRDTTIHFEQVGPFDVDLSPMVAQGCSDPSGMVLKGLPEDREFIIHFQHDGRESLEVRRSNGWGEIELLLPDGRYQNFLLIDGVTSCSSALYTDEIILMRPAAITFLLSSLAATVCGAPGMINLSELSPNTEYNVRYEEEGAERSAVLSSDTEGAIAISALAGRYSNFRVEDVMTACVSGVSDEVVMVTQSDPPPLSIAAANGPTSCGGSDGFLVLQVEFSDVEYTVEYVFEGVKTTQVLRSDEDFAQIALMNLSAGRYEQIAVVFDGCRSQTFDADLSDPVLTDLILSGVDPTACSSNNGEIQISNIPPATTLSIEYSVDGGAIQTFNIGSSPAGTAAVTNLEVGFYENIVLRLNGCSSNPMSLVLTAQEAPSFNVFPTDPSDCAASDGSILLTDLKDQELYEVIYTSAGTEDTLQIGAVGGQISIDNLPVGLYENLRVQENGCVSRSQSVALSSSGRLFPMLVSADLTSCLVPNGAILAGSLPPVSRFDLSFDSLGVPISRSIWSDAQGQIALSGLPAGTYTAVVLELNGCQSLPATFLIQNSGVDAPQPILDKVVPLQSCDPPDGTFEVGGLDPGLSYLLSYIWDGMQQDDTLLFADPSGRLVLDSFPAGLYTSIEVIKNGC